MHNIEVAAGRVIASDIQESVDAVDRAVMALARLCASIVEVSKSSSLPIAAAQTALADSGKGLVRVISSRQNMSSATRELIAIQRASTLRPVAFGCPGGFPTEGSLSEPAQKSKAV